MPKFFVEKKDFINGGIIITGDNYYHLSNVLKTKQNDTIIVCDSNGGDYSCIVSKITPQYIFAEIEDYNKNQCEPNIKIHLFQCLPKSGKMELIIQKCVELGVYKIYPVSSARCVTRLDKTRAQKKAARWRKISEAAAKQCGRGVIPDVSDVISFKEAVNIAGAYDLSIIPYEHEKENKLNMLDFKEKNDICIFIGPEGGFDDEEISLCEQNLITAVTLGNRILRTETAGMFVLSVITYVLDL